MFTRLLFHLRNELPKFLLLGAFYVGFLMDNWPKYKHWCEVALILIGAICVWQIWARRPKANHAVEKEIAEYEQRIAELKQALLSACAELEHFNPDESRRLFGIAKEELRRSTKEEGA